jgi:hypothetical protein
MKRAMYSRFKKFDYLDLLNIYAQMPYYPPIKGSGFAQDKQSIANDWLAVGNTLRDIFAKNIGNDNAEIQKKRSD